MLVPLRTAYLLPGAVERMLLPGAATSTLSLPERPEDGS